MRRNTVFEERLLLALASMWLKYGREGVNSGIILKTIMPVIEQEFGKRELQK